MKPAMLVGVLLFVVFAAIGVYYFIPLDSQHLFSSHGAHYVDWKHGAVFIVLALVALIGGRFASNAGAKAA